MSIVQVEGLIATVGFPITCVIVMAVFIFIVWRTNKNENKEREDKLYKTISDTNTLNKELSATNKEVSETNKKLVEHLTIDMSKVKSDVKDIKDLLLR